MVSYQKIIHPPLIFCDIVKPFQFRQCLAALVTSDRNRRMFVKINLRTRSGYFEFRANVVSLDV